MRALFLASLAIWLSFLSMTRGGGGLGGGGIVDVCVVVNFLCDNGVSMPIRVVFYNVYYLSD